MGLRTGAILVVGVHLEEKVRSTSVTKYHPDTGKPYQAENKEGYLAIEGTAIEIDDEADKVVGLSIIRDGEEDNRFLGIEVAKVMDYEEHWMKVPDLTPANNKVTKILREKLEYEGKVSVFLLHYVSI